MKDSIKKIVFSLSLLIGMSLSLVACGQNSMPYPFLYESDGIREIQIIRLGLQNDYQTFQIEMMDECIILADIEDTFEFIEKFNNDVLFSRYWIGDPTELKSGDYVIKVTYINGDFELIGYYAQRIFVQDADRGYIDWNGVKYGTMPGLMNCDSDSFMGFINLYVDDSILN